MTWTERVSRRRTVEVFARDAEQAELLAGELVAAMYCDDDVDDVEVAKLRRLDGEKPDQSMLEFFEHHMKEAA